MLYPVQSGRTAKAPPLNCVKHWFLNLGLLRGSNIQRHNKKFRNEIWWQIHGCKIMAVVVLATAASAIRRDANLKVNSFT